MDRKLYWENFNWGYFQTLCVAVAENSFPDCRFDEYLQPGHKQEGIDLYSVHKKDGSHLSIQCKRVKKITPYQLQKIADEFINGNFNNKSSVFILATSANLQSPQLQEAIDVHKQTFRKDHNIVFECWDRQHLETRLKNMWGVVSYYFGKPQADLFCYPQLKHSALHNLHPIPKYIPRKMVAFSIVDPVTGTYYSPKKELFDLKNILTQDRRKTSHICLIADAYQGKSTYLQQTAWQLKEEDLGIQPLLIDIKKYNVQPLETLLTTLYGSWQNIGYKDILLVIDGLDEAPTDKFIEMVKHIHEFSEAYQPVNMLLSCRKLFFNHYEVKKWLPDFSVYELDGLDTNDIHSFLHTKLKGNYPAFKEEIQRREMWGMLYHPFYLVNLTDDFLLPPYKIPDTKLKVLDACIERAFQRSQHRQIMGSDAVKQDSYLFKQTIERFAFAMQLAGVNAFSDTDIQQLFPYPKERLLLQHNALVAESGGAWSFTNALFQEHLAASFLITLEPEKFITYCTVGTTFKKVKTKWIQTISSALSLLHTHDPRFAQLLQIIEDDNIELIFQTERSKYTHPFILDMLQRLLEKCNALNIRPMIVHEETIAVFIENTAGCIDYLLHCLEETAFTERTKIICCHILQYARLSQLQLQKYTDLFFPQLLASVELYYAEYLVDVLTYQEAGDQALIQQLISIDRLNQLQAFRDRVYRLIMSLGLVDDFYQYGLEGYPCLLAGNYGRMYEGADINLKPFLGSAGTLNNFSLLLQQAKKGNPLSDYIFEGHQNKVFVADLFKKLTSFYFKNPLIIFPVAAFIKDLGIRFLREEFSDVHVFLEETASNWLVVRILVNDFFVDHEWELGTLISPSCYDYLLYEYEEGNYGHEILQMCLHGLQYRQNKQQTDSFYQLCMAVTEGSIENKYEQEIRIQQEQIQKQKRRNDVTYIQSSAAFRNGLIKHFDTYGKKSITTDDLFVELEGNHIRKMTDSHFLYEYLWRWVRSEKNSITLKECLEHLQDEEWFERFRAEEIADYPYEDEDTSQEIMPFLESYYLKHVQQANFKNCIWTEGDRMIWHTLEHQLGFFFKKFRFNTPEDILIEMVWLDIDGVRGMESARHNKQNTISELILQQLSPAGSDKFRHKIISNIKEGIKHEGVWGTHIGLCKTLGITEARECIIQSILDQQNDKLDRIDAATIYLELGGDINQLIRLYQSITDYNSYFFYHLTILLHKKHPEAIVVTALAALQAAYTTADRKTHLAQILAETGIMEGFSYMVHQLRMHPTPPHTIHGGRPITNIDTRAALQELESLAYLLIDKRYQDQSSMHDSPKLITIEWLNALALKSETDMLLVITFLEQIKEQYAPTYSESEIKDLNWYTIKILEAFRGSDKADRSLSEIKKIISA